jgi:hypothetical protein
LAPFCSFFQQILKFIPRGEFDNLVAKHSTERHARGFSSWNQYVAMLYCQFGGAQSLRDICDGLDSMQGKTSHLGIGTTSKSTLSYANKHRSYRLFEDAFYAVLGRVQTVLQPRHHFRFKNKLLSLDSTTIDLCASVFDWAHYMRTKGAVKLHMVLDHAGYLPVYCAITTGKASDIQLARSLSLESGTVVVFDRGYIDFPWLQSLTDGGVWFVTRLRRSDPVEVIENYDLPPSSPVIADEKIRVGKPRADGFEPLILRRVTVLDDKGKRFEIVTNNFQLAASTIGKLYRDRWQIELFFKAIKQNLEIKTFVGTSANALKIQVWAALTTLVLLKFLQLKSRAGWSFCRLVSLFRMHLFSYRDLMHWIDDPFGVPEPDLSDQLTIQFGQHQANQGPTSRVLSS